ncbi:MAG: AAA family ATPase [Proteocatella sp.]
MHNDMRLKGTSYKSVYPFMLFSKRDFGELDFSPITILYGGNGSGKTSLLNVMAEKLKLNRGTYFNQSPFFDDYVNMCEYAMAENVSEIPAESRIIASDDVFDYMLDVRCMNQNIDEKREILIKEYREEKYASFQLKSLDDFEALKRKNDMKRMTTSKFVKSRLMKNVTEKSNGESAYMYFTEHIKENSLYLLDEPENSLEVGAQMELAKFIEDSARFFGCQFVISTHSPFLMAMKGAYVYDLDSVPVERKRWTELKNVRLYYEFFKNHEAMF